MTFAPSSSPVPVDRRLWRAEPNKEMTMNSRPRKNAKIVATVGPASDDRQTIEALFDAGADVFRLNFSHGTHEDHRRRLETLREVERARGRQVGVLMDLQGPKLRIGTFADGPIQLAEGARF